MIRVVFWVLLIANLVLFSVMQWGSSLLKEENVTQSPLNAEKIRLLEAKEIALIEGNTKKMADSETSLLCFEWGEFSDAELKGVMDALSDAALADKQSKREVEYEIGYWVFIPPLKDKTATAEKISQLKERSVTEYFVVQEPGPWQNAISLGVFKTQEAAQNYLAELRTHGVRSAQVGERGSKLKVNILRFNEVDGEIGAKLTELQKGFAGSELKSVQCGLTRQG